MDMVLTTLSTGEEVHFYRKSIVIAFKGNRKVLSTSPDNGGLREDLKAVFNNDGTRGAGIASTLRAPTYAKHMALVASELGLDPLTTAGISTAAQMENVSIKSKTYKEITVTAIVTGGIEVNGGRVGDPASWDELERDVRKPEPTSGTINIILHINVNLSPGALVRSLVTCTEAKTAAIQELLAPSKYSMGLATGSGTDSTIIVANTDSDILLTNAGKHCKLGELIGKSVTAAVKEALCKQTGLSPVFQHNVFRRVERFGITNDSLWEKYKEGGGVSSRAKFEECVETLMIKDSLVTYTSLYCHLIDQFMWGLISLGEVIMAGNDLLKLMGMSIPDMETKAAGGIHLMIRALERGLLELTKIELEGGEKQFDKL